MRELAALPDRRHPVDRLATSEAFPADRHHQWHAGPIDDNGRIVHAWGGLGAQPGQFNVPHMLACDDAGNLFVAEIDGMRMQKFTRKK